MRRSALNPMAALAAVSMVACPPAVAGPVYIPAVREMAERRTLTSRTYLLADGTYRLEATLEPINYLSDDGTLTPIDTNLVATAKPGFTYVNEANTIHTYFPKDGRGWIRVERGTAAVRFRAVEAAVGTTSRSGSGFAISGVAPGLDLAYEVQPNKLKETLTLAAPGPAQFRFALQMEGLTGTLDEDGGVTLSDANGIPVLALDAPWMEDASGAISHSVMVSLVPDQDGYAYTITPDEQWLAAAKYPVVVDPTIRATFVSPGAWTSYDYPTTWNVATPDLHVGGNLSGTPSVGPMRGFVQFSLWDTLNQTWALPPDAEVLSSNLQFYVEANPLNYTPITLEARELPLLITPPNGIVWSTDAQRMNPVVGTDLNAYAGGPPTTFGYGSFGAYSAPGLDTTDVVQSWADKRYAIDGYGVQQRLPVNIVIHDILDQDAGSACQNIMCISTNPGGLNPMRLFITYSTPGWYTFQGNYRRTGRTQYDVSPNATQKFARALRLLGNSAEGPDARVGQELQEIEPAPVAVQDPDNPNSGLPIVYAVVGYHRAYDSAHPNQLLIYSRVWRIQDNDTNSSPTIFSQELPVYATGTPLVQGGVIYITGNSAFNGGTGHLMALSAANLALLWDRTLPGSVYSSPVFSPSATQYQTEDDAWHTNYHGAILVAPNIDTGEPYGSDRMWIGYMFAIDPTPDTGRYPNGLYVWGKVAANGDLSANDWGLLLPFQFNATYSSPCRNATVAYNQDHSCWVNARNLVNGGMLWANESDHLHEESSISVFNADLFWGGVRMAYANGAVSCMRQEQDQYGYVTGESVWFALNEPIRLDRLESVWSTLAFYGERNTLFFGDDLGRVYGVGTQLDSLTRRPYVKWPAVQTIVNNPQVRCSPLVAGHPGGTPVVYIGADDWYIHAYAGLDGTPVTLGPGLSSIKSGPIRSSMAAYQGRLYVLSAGQPDSSGTLILTPPKLYCFH